jgi:tetratricopeptide (TPR) repeat protein
LAKADYDLADASRAAARYLCAKYQTPTQQLWFEGHWGFQYYMEQLGAKPLDFAYHKLVPGELVALPAPASFAPALPSDLGKLVEAAAYTSDAPCSTMTYSGKAAFYCALYGPLPFVFGQPDPATFSVYEVTRADDRGELQQFLSPKPTLEEITKYQALVAAHPNDSQAHFQLGNLLAGTGRTAEAIKHYRAGLQLTPGSPEALNNLAWILATDADATLRNAPEAVQTAEKACRLTNRKAAHYVGTLAAAYAEAGRFDEAVATGTEAIALAEAAGQPDLANTNRQMLDLYRAKRAYHQGGAIER